MIRYAEIRKQPLTLGTLQKFLSEDARDVGGHVDPDIRNAVKGWLDKADKRTAQLVAAGAYTDVTADRKKWNTLSARNKHAVPEPVLIDWATVKYLFMEIQGDKCAYCERKMAAGGDGGSGEHDLEHFRPKNPVKKWRAPQGLGIETGEKTDQGYYWLAFHLLNYCTSCLKCNRGLKHDHFPIAGTRYPPHNLPGQRSDKSEQPDLIYPLGTHDDDPEAVIRFRGVAAYPPEGDLFLPLEERTDARRNRRAKVTIAFFKLNSRDELIEGRAKKLRELEKSMELLNSVDPDVKAHAKQDLVNMTCGIDEHTACVRAMIRLHRRDPARAIQYFAVIRAYVDTKTPRNFGIVNGEFVEMSRQAP